MFPDSKIAEKFTFSNSKQGYSITHGLGPHYNEQLVTRLQNEFFSINIDESTVLKRNQLAISVRYFHRGLNRIVMEHFKTIDIEKKDAETLVKVLKETFLTEGIAYATQLISVETDSCPAMRGVRGGLVTKLKNSIEYLYDLGGCPDHHIANAIKYAFLAFDSTIKNIFVDVYQDLEKYPTHQQRYKEACKHIGIEEKPMLRMVDTRWTIIETCAARVYEQFDALEHMYSKVTLSKKDLQEKEANRLFRLVQQFTSHTAPLLKLKLLFLQHAASRFNVCIKILEKEEPLIHAQHELLGKLVYDHLATFLKPSAISAVSYKDLVEVKYMDKDNHLTNQNVVLPTPVKRLLEDMGFSEHKNVYEKFMKDVKAFNTKCAERMIHYCKIQLTSKIVISLSALDPTKRSDETLSAKLLYLQKKFANVIPFVNRDELADEVRDYQGATSADIPRTWHTETQETESGKHDVLLDVSTYWARVGQLKVMKVTDGVMVSVPRFPLLAKLSAALLTVHHSAAEVERTFSVEKEILTLKRNKMSQDTFNAHLLIRNNVRSVGGCDKIKNVITPEMRKAYIRAPARRKEYLEKRRVAQAKQAEVLNVIRKRKLKETANLHKHKLRELTKQIEKEKQKRSEVTKELNKNKQKSVQKRPLSDGENTRPAKKQKRAT